MGLLRKTATCPHSRTQSRCSRAYSPVLGITMLTDSGATARKCDSRSVSAGKASLRMVSEVITELWRGCGQIRSCQLF